MKKSHLIASSISLGCLVGGVHLLTQKEPEHEGVKILTHSVPDRMVGALENKASLSQGPSSAIVSSEGLEPIDFINKILETNPSIKRKIVGMQWYKDALSGRISRETFEQYIKDMFSIELLLGSDPSILNTIQYENWWQRYLSGQTSPSDMFQGNLKAFLDIQKIAQQSPELYEKAKQNPNWNLGIQQGEDFIVVGKREYLISLQLRMKFLNENPDIEVQMQQHGFTRENLFTDDWSKGEGIYGFLNTLQEVLNRGER